MRASEQGSYWGQYNLGRAYKSGIGTPENIVKAHMWFNLSAFNGHAGGAEIRDMLSKRMAPKQINDAQSQAEVCISKKYRSC